MIQLKSAREIEIMAEGGRILAATIEELRKAVRPGISTGELDRIAERWYGKAKAKRPGRSSAR